MSRRASWFRPMQLRTVAARSALTVALLILFVLMWLGRHQPALGTDSLTYHLAIPAEWLARGYLCPIDLPFHDSAAEHSPMLSQTAVYLLMRLTGDDGLTWMLQPVMLLLMGWLFIRSARLAGARRPLAVATAALMLLYRPFVQSMCLVNNDLVLTFGCAVFLHGLLCIGLRPRRGSLLAGAGLAVMLATKVIAIVYVAAAAAPLALVLWRRGRGEPARRWLLWLAPLVLLPLAGSAFFLRNWLTLGNPLYPATVKVFGATVFQGLYDSSVLIDHHWSPAALASMLLRGNGPFGPLLPVSAILLLSVPASAALLAARRLRRVGLARLAACVIFPLAAVLVYFAVTPFWREHRLLFPLAYALHLSFVHAMGAAGRLWRGRLGPAVEVGAIILLAWHVAVVGAPPLWLVAAAVAVAGASTLRPVRRLRPWLWPAVGAVLIAGAASGLWWYPSYAYERAAARPGLYAAAYGAEGRAWNVVTEMTRGRGATVAYAGTPMIFPLYGPELRNRVRYVPVSSLDRPTPIDLKPGGWVYRELAVARRAVVDDEYWLAGLRREGVELLLLSNRPDRHGGTAAELSMIARHPELFRQVFADDGVYVYEVLPPATGSHPGRQI